MADKLTDPTDDFRASVARALGLDPAVEHSETFIVIAAANLKTRLDTLERRGPGLDIPSPDTPVAECTAALTALQNPVPEAPVPFAADPTVRQACAIILAGLILGQRADTEGLGLRRHHAIEIERIFRDAGWGNVTAGGVSNSPPNTGANELWTVSAF